METETVHGSLTSPPDRPLPGMPRAEPWPVSPRLTRAGLGARDADWEELLAPPASGVLDGGAWVVLGDRVAPWGSREGSRDPEGRGSAPEAEPSW